MVAGLDLALLGSIGMLLDSRPHNDETVQVSTAIYLLLLTYEQTYEQYTSYRQTYFA